MRHSSLASLTFGLLLLPALALAQNSPENHPSTTLPSTSPPAPGLVIPPFVAQPIAPPPSASQGFSQDFAPTPPGQVPPSQSSLTSGPSFVTPRGNLTPLNPLNFQGDELSRRAQSERQSLRSQENKLSTAASPPTAAEQGYGQAQDSARLQYEATLEASLHSPQQTGEVVPSSLPSAPVATNPALAGWFQNWEQALVMAGASPAKINFEASRLSQSAFALWASNQLRYVPASPSVLPAPASSSPALAPAVTIPLTPELSPSAPSSSTSGQPNHSRPD